MAAAAAAGVVEAMVEVARMKAMVETATAVAMVEAAGV